MVDTSSLAVQEGDPLVYPKCGGTMREIGLIQEPKVIDKILKHLREKGRDARAGPWAWRVPRRARRR